MYKSSRSKDGSINPVLLKIIERLSKGEIGLIIPKFIYSFDNYKTNPSNSAIVKQKDSQSWISTIQKVHKNGSKLVFRIWHQGLNTIPNVNKTPDHILDLTQTEIEDIIEAFQKTAHEAKKVGADGIELNESYDHLFSKFLSPLNNHRTDKYGGSFENRARIVSETAEAIKKVAGPDFTVLVNMNGNQLMKYGTSLEMASHYISIIKKTVDMFEVSCDIPNINVKTLKEDKEDIIKNAYLFMLSEAFNLSYAEFIKQNNPDTVVASVGKYSNVSFMEDAVLNHSIDAISISNAMFNVNSIKKINTGSLSKIH